MKIDALHTLADTVEPEDFVRVILDQCSGLMRPRLDVACNLHHILGSGGPFMRSDLSHSDALNRLWIYADGHELSFSPADLASSKAALVDDADHNIQIDCPFTVISYSIFFPDMHKHWATIPYRNNAYYRTLKYDTGSHWVKADSDLLDLSLSIGYYMFYTAVASRTVDCSEFLAYT